MAFAFISFLHIVLGELAPKSIAIRRAEVVALNTALPLYVFYWAMYPFIYVLNGAANVAAECGSGTFEICGRICVVCRISTRMLRY